MLKAVKLTECPHFHNWPEIQYRGSVGRVIIIVNMDARRRRRNQFIYFLAATYIQYIGPSVYLISSIFPSQHVGGSQIYCRGQGSGRLPLGQQLHFNIIYIEGFVPSQADTAVFEAFKGAPMSDIPMCNKPRDGKNTSMMELKIRNSWFIPNKV